MFAGGIGEKGASLRKAIVDKCKCLGFELDNEKNDVEIKDVVQDIGRESSRHRVLVCQTDEQVSRESHLSFNVRKLTAASSSKWLGRVRYERMWEIRRRHKQIPFSIQIDSSELVSTDMDVVTGRKVSCRTAVVPI